MRSYVQVVTTPTADTAGTSVILHFDSKRYLIGNVPEGLQRACVETGTKFTRLNEVFVSGRANWANIGGVLGLILTLADRSRSASESTAEHVRRAALAKAKKLGVAHDEGRIQQIVDEMHGDSTSRRLMFFSPPNLNYMLATSRRFIFRKGTPVQVEEIAENRNREDVAMPYWEDKNIKVWPMSVLPSSSTKADRPPQSRKRSFEMLEEDDQRADRAGTRVAVLSDDTPKEDHDKLIVQSVVEQMFNSTWQLDALTEIPLANVPPNTPIFFRDLGSHGIQKYEGPLPGGATPLSEADAARIVLVRKPWPSSETITLPPAEPAQESVSYIIKNHPVRGKFDPKKATALKVPKGPKWAALTAGQEVESEDGAIIKSAQVLGGMRPGTGFAFIDLPDPTYIAPLLARREWRESDIIIGVDAFIWNCGKNVFSDPRIQKFISDHAHVKHILSSAEDCGNRLTFDGSAASTIRLQQVDDKRYRTPTHDASATAQIQQRADLTSNISIAQRGLKLQLTPTVEIQKNEIVAPLDIQSTISGVSSDVLTKAEQAHTAIINDSIKLEKWARKIPGRDVEITTLGTGSALPSKFRNVSATLLRVPGWGAMLFDCGENTVGQLRRAFSDNEYRQILRDLKIVSISHMHADHHLGLTGLIRAWYEEVHQSLPGPSAVGLMDGLDRLTVIATVAMHHWLHEYSSMEDFGYSRLAPLVMSIRQVLPRVVPKQFHTHLWWYVPEQQYSIPVSPDLLNLSDFQAVMVKHCHGARAVAVTWKDGFKASFSGDCRPSMDFVRIGFGSTVCIHEATFDDELRGDAVAKHHSTTSEALNVAQSMQAKTCILTHFSQRYQKLPVIERITESVVDMVPVQVKTDDASEVDSSSFTPSTLVTDVQGMDEDTDGPSTVSGQPEMHNDLINDDNNTSTYRPMRRRRSSSDFSANFRLTSDMKVACAFDMMRVKVGEIAEMEYFTPSLLELFDDETMKTSDGGDDAPDVDRSSRQANQSVELTKPKRQTSASNHLQKQPDLHVQSHNINESPSHMSQARQVQDGDMLDNDPISREQQRELVNAAWQLMIMLRTAIGEHRLDARTARRLTQKLKVLAEDVDDVLHRTGCDAALGPNMQSKLPAKSLKMHGIGAKHDGVSNACNNEVQDEMTSVDDTSLEINRLLKTIFGKDSQTSARILSQQWAVDENTIGNDAMVGGISPSILPGANGTGSRKDSRGNDTSYHTRSPRGSSPRTSTSFAEENNHMARAQAMRESVHTSIDDVDPATTAVMQPENAFTSSLYNKHHAYGPLTGVARSRDLRKCTDLTALWGEADAFTGTGYLDNTMTTSQRALSELGNAYAHAKPGSIRFAKSMRPGGRRRGSTGDLREAVEVQPDKIKQQVFIRSNFTECVAPWEDGFGEP